MSYHAIEPERLTELRNRAASRLTGAAATKGPAARAVDALSVLHALASSADTASDALALLHELQVHQVELDLQAEELHESRAELESALRRQTDLYDLLPVGCLAVDARLVLHALNQTGADMLGIGRDEAAGRGLDAFVGVADARRLKASIASLDAGVRRASCPLKLLPEGGVESEVLASIGRHPSENLVLVSLTRTADEPEHRRHLS